MTQEVVVAVVVDTDVDRSPRQEGDGVFDCVAGLAAFQPQEGRMQQVFGILYVLGAASDVLERGIAQRLVDGNIQHRRFPSARRPTLTGSLNRTVRKT